MQKLLESNFHIGADASAAAGPVGRHAEAGTDCFIGVVISDQTEAGMPRKVVMHADGQETKPRTCGLLSFFLRIALLSRQEKEPNDA